MGRRAPATAATTTGAASTFTVARRRSGRGHSPTATPPSASKQKSSPNQGESKKKGKKSTGGDVFEFDQPDHEIAYTPQPTARSHSRTRQDTPTPAATSSSSGKKSRPHHTTPPRRAANPLKLTERALTPPRFGTDLSKQGHSSLSPVDVPLSGDSSSSSRSPSEVWHRLLDRDVARVVAPVSPTQRMELEAALMKASPAKKRSLSPSAGSPAHSPTRLSVAQTPARPSTKEESPKKRQKQGTSQKKQSRSPTPTGRRSTRLEHEPRKNLKEPETDEEEDDEEEKKSEPARTSRSRAPATPSSTSTPRRARVAPAPEPEMSLDAEERMAQMRNYFEDLDATPFGLLFEVRPQR